MFLLFRHYAVSALLQRGAVSETYIQAVSSSRNKISITLQEPCSIQYTGHCSNYAATKYYNDITNKTHDTNKR